MQSNILSWDVLVYKMAKIEQSNLVLSNANTSVLLVAIISD